MRGRIVGTIVALAGYWVARLIYSPAAMVIGTRQSGTQFEDTDVGFVTTSWWQSLMSGIDGLMLLALLLLLLLIWGRPIAQTIRSAFNEGSNFAILFAVGAAITLFPQFVWSFAETSDKTEVRGIEPDETAFLLPNFGATGENQAQYRSEQYLNRPDIKVPGKFVVMRHQKLAGTGGASGLASLVGFDYFVSTHTLAKVKRSPFSRSWTVPGRGTNSTVDESFPCQTKGGHNIMKVGVSIWTEITDDQAAKYFATWGFEPAQGDPGELQTIFTSVRYARRLLDVMDNVVHAWVHNLVCNQILTYDDPLSASQAMAIILGEVEKKLRPLLLDTGITLKMVGWADTWTFDDEIQFAINQKFIASQIADSLPILERNALVNVFEGIGAGSRKQPPSILAIPDKLFDSLKPGNLPIASHK